MPTGWDQVEDDLRADIVAAIAPYQPNILPRYPNAAATAGQIAPTIVTSGHPLQYPLTERLENSACQISVYFDNGKEKQDSYINEDVQPGTYVPGVPIPQQIAYGHSRSSKFFTIAVWGYSRASRGAVADVILAQYGDYYRLTHADGFVSLLRYQHRHDNDAEMLDSMYLSEFVYSINTTMTVTYDTTVVQTTDLEVRVNPPV